MYTYMYIHIYTYTCIRNYKCHELDIARPLTF